MTISNKEKFFLFTIKIKYLESIVNFLFSSMIGIKERIAKVSKAIRVLSFI